MKSISIQERSDIIKVAFDEFGIKPNPQLQHIGYTIIDMFEEKQANGAEQNESNCNVPIAIKSVCCNCNTEVEPIPLGHICPNCACDM